MYLCKIFPDYLSNNLYWIDSVKSTIEVISIKNKKRAIVWQFSKANNPVSIAVVPSLGAMFVAFQSPGNVHIDKLLMNGSHYHFHVIESGMSQDGQISIVVDEVNRMIYWSDSETHKIEFSNYEGTNAGLGIV